MEILATFTILDKAMKTLSQFVGFDLDMQTRMPVGDGLTWRLAALDDMPRLRQLWTEMDARVGEKQDRPDLFTMPVVLALVTVNEQGVIEDAVYGEAVVDFTVNGISRKVARYIDPLFPTLHFFLFDRNIRVARMLVPR